MFTVRVWNENKVNTHFIAPSIEDLFELVCLLDKNIRKESNYFFTVMNMDGFFLQQKEFGWGGFEYWKINSNYKDNY